jgi:hypothetical protein
VDDADAAASHILDVIAEVAPQLHTVPVSEWAGVHTALADEFRAFGRHASRSAAPRLRDSLALVVAFIVGGLMVVFLR